MRKILVLAAVVALTARANTVNENVVYDSTKVEQLQEVVVKGVRAQKNAPFAIDFSQIPMSERPAFFQAHPELMITR